VVDAENGRTRQDLATLAAAWDGTALICSTTPIDSRFLNAGRAEQLALIAGLAIVCSSSAIYYRYRRREVAALRLRWGQEALLVGVASIVAAFSYHATADYGLLNHMAAVHAVQLADRFSFVPTLGVADVRSALAKQYAVIIDARLPRDYSAGHIPGALS